MRRSPWLLLGLSALLPACSRTAPESQYPPPGPRDGLPFIPLVEREPEGDASDAPAEAAATTKPTGIDGSLPSAPPTTLDRSQTCRDEVCTLTALLPDPAFARATPSGAESPGALWLADIAPGSTLAVPRHQHADLVALTVAGEALASGDDGGRGLKLGAWSALRAPGAGVTFKAGTAGAKLVIGVAASKGNLSDLVTSLQKKPSEVRWKKRPGALAQVSLARAEDLAWADGAFHVRIAFGGEPAIPASLETLLTSADAAIKEHEHGSFEHIAILDGSGTMRVGDRDYAVRPGSVFDLAPGEKHSFTPAGDRPLVAVQMYTPSGAEQRFVKLAKGGAAPASEAPEK